MCVGEFGTYVCEEYGLVYIFFPSLLSSERNERGDRKEALTAQPLPSLVFLLYPVPTTSSSRDPTRVSFSLLLLLFVGGTCRGTDEGSPSLRSPPLLAVTPPPFSKLSSSSSN